MVAIHIPARAGSSTTNGISKLVNNAPVVMQTTVATAKAGANDILNVVIA